MLKTICFLIILIGGINTLKADRIPIVLTTTMIESAVKELIDKNSNFEIIRIIPPHSCPGHFDLNPGHLPSLKDSKLIILHGYQQSLKDKLINIGIDENKILVLESKGNLLIPANYYNFTEAIAEHMIKTDESSKDIFLSRLEKLEGKIRDAEDMIAEYRPLFSNFDIIVSEMQKDFCSHLGFNIKESFRRGEDMSPKDIQRIISHNADLIIANLQEGIKAAESISDRMNLPLVILSNFPDFSEFGNDYFSLLDRNLNNLLKTCQPD